MQAESVRSSVLGVLRGHSRTGCFFEMCVPHAEPASFPQRHFTTRAGGVETCRAPPPAVASCMAGVRREAWAQGVGAGGIPITFSETQRTLHSRHTVYDYVLYVPTTFLLYELGTRPCGYGYKCMGSRIRQPTLLSSCWLTNSQTSVACTS